MAEKSVTGDAAAAGPGLGRERIEHVIVLMMENRSFDHLLGYLRHDDPSYPYLGDAPPRCPVDPARPDGDLVPTSDDAAPVLGVDPDHSNESVLLQIYGQQGVPDGATPRMNGFIRSYSQKISHGSLRRKDPLLDAVNAVIRFLTDLWNRLRRRPKPVRPRPEDIMRCFAETGVPVLATLAREYAVLVNWHASVPGETWPNRNFAHAATSDGTANIDLRFYDNETIFEQLGEAGRRWHVYHDGLAQVLAFPRLWLGGTDGFHDSAELVEHIRTDRLPEYSFVEPDHGYGRGDGDNQHPGNNTVIGDNFTAGEALIGRIHNALVETPDVFAKTLLLITYDQHGGLFDHVPPRPVPSPDGKVAPNGFDFRLSGLRVPTVAVSPLIPRGTVEHAFFEHASIPRTLRGQFAPGFGPLTERDAQAADVLEVLPLLAAPRSDCRAVEIPGPVRAAAGTTRAAAGPAAGRALNDFEASLLELAGAVWTWIRRETVARREAVAAIGRPVPFVPDPTTSAAARARVVVPGSDADRVVVEVVTHLDA